MANFCPIAFTRFLALQPGQERPVATPKIKHLGALWNPLGNRLKVRAQQTQGQSGCRRLHGHSRVASGAHGQLAGSNYEQARDTLGRP